MRFYGPLRRRENPAYCIREVSPRKGGDPRQCSRYRGYGRHGQFCKQHAQTKGWDIEKGIDTNRCQQMVERKGKARGKRQCLNSPGFGPLRSFCPAHAP